jgi:hypothetical protein
VRGSIVTRASGALTPAESARLADLESIVKRGITTFVEVGNALFEIREAGLYRETHATFSAYCKEQWGFSDSRGRQMIAAAKTVTDVTAAGLPAPRTEGEARRVARSLREARSLEQHPRVRGLLPDIEGEQWVSFADSIRRRGLIQPIHLYEGKILDGWQRYRACMEVGAELRFQNYTGEHPLAYWFACNLIRTHKTSAERDRAEQLAREEARRLTLTDEVKKDADALWQKLGTREENN